MDALGFAAAFVALVALLIWTSRRWGRPRLYVPGVVALWVAAALLALIVVALALR